MLGARIDEVEAPIRNLIAYLPSLPDKKTTTAVVKQDNQHDISSHCMSTHVAEWQ